MKGKKYLAGRDAAVSQTIEEQEQIVLEAGGELDEESTFQEEVIEEAEKQGLETHDVKGELDEAEQQTLPGVHVEKEKVVAVQGNRILAEFVRPHFSMDEGTRLCALEFSFPLTKEHKGKLPKPVEAAWHFLDKRGYRGVVGIEVSDQVLDIFLSPKDKKGDVELHIGEAAIDKATVALVKEIGKGASEKVVRFSFRVVVEVTKNVAGFACHQYGNQFWIEMSQSQGELEI